MNLNNVTSEDIIDFYSDKEAYPPYTTKFIKSYRQKNEGYIDFAKMFQMNEIPHENKKTEIMISNYQKIIKLKQQNNLHLIPSFRTLEIEFITDVCTDQENGNPNQKWHLMVSYFGQTYLEEKTGNIFNRTITCPELWLWLIETAKDDKEISDEMIDDVYQTAIKYKTDNSFSREKWKCFLDPYKSRVKKIIFDRKQSISD